MRFFYCTLAPILTLSFSETIIIFFLFFHYWITSIYHQKMKNPEGQFDLIEKSFMAHPLVGYNEINFIRTQKTTTFFRTMKKIERDEEKKTRNSSTRKIT